MPSALVSTDWLADNLESPDLRIIDATCYLPTDPRDPRAEYEAAHIPGALFFDIDDVKDDADPRPHMVPPPARFSLKVRRLGLGDGVRVVCYDANDFCASARAWWMFRLFGATDVWVLDGGLAKWQAEGRPIEDMARLPSERHFTARQNNILYRDLDQIRRNLTDRREQLVDARPKGRFDGLDPEPRDGLKRGHVPGSRNLPHADLVDPETHQLRSPDELRRAFEVAGIDISQPVVTTCGSGVSAAILNLALYELGQPDAALYDGSWAEWGALDDTPVATA